MRERTIERRLLNALGDLGWADAHAIRRCSVAPGFGVVDLLLLPKRGRHKVVLIEAKRSLSPEAAGKVVGQLLQYYAGLTGLGSAGLRAMRTYCDCPDSRARGTGRKSLQAIAGVRPAVAAWQRLQRGRPIDGSRVGLFIALETDASERLKAVLSALAKGYGLRVGVIAAPRGATPEIWWPADRG